LCFVAAGSASFPPLCLRYLGSPVFGVEATKHKGQKNRWRFFFVFFIFSVTTSEFGFSSATASAAVQVQFPSSLVAFGRLLVFFLFLKAFRCAPAQLQSAVQVY
jgi:hypothetical protein